MSGNIEYAVRLRTLPNPSHALRAYIGGIESLNRLNAEDITADGWRGRFLNISAINQRRWDALSEEDQQRAREVAD